MEQMYQDYKDIAEFRIVYIKEAHAIDSRRAVPYAIDEGINQPTTYADRCLIADMLVQTGTLTIPIIIDSIDDRVNELYRGLPSRVFLVRSDGILDIAAERGPWGFPPALEQAGEWLAQYKKTGKEPELSKE